tara:strand:+ start:1229 stop:2629 length:1401 start_codon:yes stop_codon:yes gene_type:complete
MTSKIKVDNINKVSDDSNIINKCGSAVTVGASGNTVAVAGNDIRSDSYKASDGGVIISQSGTTVTIGASGDTINLASGASQSGFGREGSVDWQTGSIKTTTFTAANGEGYFCDTSSAGFTVNLPAGVAGYIIAFADYTRTFSSGNLTVAPNGSEKIGGVAQSAILSTDGEAATFVYVDSTEGWINVQNADNTITGVTPFLVKYQVVAGGGGGGGASSNPGSGGGGAGGFRIRYDSPLNAPADLTIYAGTTYPITVGAGGANGTSGSRTGTNGSNSVFSTIISAGGGGGAGGGDPAKPAALDGGSGGGGSYCGTSPAPPGGAEGGSGNTPPVSPPQGQDGADGQKGYGRGAGGGGAGGAGNAGSNNCGGPGGAGVASCISGSPVTKATGGTGGSYASPCGANAPANSGNGGNGHGGPGGGGTGGSGIVYVRYPTSGAPPTVGQSGGSAATVGSCTVVTYTSPGSFTA